VSSATIDPRDEGLLGATRVSAGPGRDASQVLEQDSPRTDADAAGSAATEWAALVATAVLGTDRRPLPPAEIGWDAWSTDADAAVELLDRAAAVVAAQRAGVRPGPPVAMPPPAPIDARPPCPPACAMRLDRMLRGEHDILLPEWFGRCEATGFQLPWVVLPVLLLRGRRQPELDAVVRRIAGERARWLADAVPELGIRADPPKPKTPVEPLRPPPIIEDSAAMVSTIVGAFVEHAVTWAAAPQLRHVVAALDPAWLSRLVAEIAATSFDPPAERTRRELISLAEFRDELIREFTSAS
jgi:hypothetical protein